MASIDRAALLEQLGHEEAAKVLRALEQTEPTSPTAEPAKPGPQKQPWEIAEDARRAEGQALLDQMRAQGIIAAGTAPEDEAA